MSSIKVVVWLSNSHFSTLGIYFAFIFVSVLKKTIAHIAIYLLTASVFFASTGVSVHQFYCYCMGQMTASIFKPGDPCDSGSMADCCKSKLPEVVQKCDGKKDCSDCTSKYVQLDSEYLVFSSDFELNLPLNLPSAKFKVVEDIDFKPSIVVWENDLPPPPWGKSLLLHIQSFLC